MYESYCSIFYDNLAVFLGSSLAIAVGKRVKFCAIYYTLQPEFVPGGFPFAVFISAVYPVVQVMNNENHIFELRSEECASFIVHSAVHKIWFSYIHNFIIILSRV